MQTSFNDEWDETQSSISARFTTDAVDADAIVKLRRQGWTPEQIAYDMGLDYDAVLDVIDANTDCDLTDHLHFLGE
jgi:uncharacterized protein (DUF433 family)